MGLGRRLFTLGPDNDAIRVRLYVQPSGERWAAMVPGDSNRPPAPTDARGVEPTIERRETARTGPTGAGGAGESLAGVGRHGSRATHRKQ